MSAFALTLGDKPLNLDTLDACLHQPLHVSVADAAWQRVERGRTWVEQLMRGSAAVYGINTGFGHLKNKRVPGDQLDKLQENLILSHAVGVGPPAPPEIVRWMLLFKLNMLLHGHSGVRPDLVRHMQTCLNAGHAPDRAHARLARSQRRPRPPGTHGDGHARPRRDVRAAGR